MHTHNTYTRMHKHTYTHTHTHTHIHTLYPLLSTISATSVTCLGHEFRVGAVVCLQRPSDAEYPVFGEVVRIPIQDDRKFFVVKLFTTIEFSHHFFAYKVMLTENYEALALDELALHQVLHKYCVLSNYYVVVRSCDHVELFV